MKFAKVISLAMGVLFVFSALASSAVAANSFFTTPSKAAKVQKVPLVTAFNKCTGANTSYDSPFTASACVPPINDAAADILWGPKGVGSVSLVLKSSNTKDYNGNTVADSPTDSDIIITLVLADIRVGGDTTPADNALYSGPMGGGTAGVRITSTGNIPVATNGSGTTANTAFPVQDPPGQDCASGKCKIITSSDATVPGVTVDGEQSNIEVGVPLTSSSGQVIVSGPSGDAFATPGAFVP